MASLALSYRFILFFSVIVLNSQAQIEANQSLSNHYELTGKILDSNDQAIEMMFNVIPMLDKQLCYEGFLGEEGMIRRLQQRKNPNKALSPNLIKLLQISFLRTFDDVVILSFPHSIIGRYSEPIDDIDIEQSYKDQSKEVCVLLNNCKKLNKNITRMCYRQI